MVDGCLALVDNNGNVGLFGCDGAAIWKMENLKLGDGGFVSKPETEAIINILFITSNSVITVF